MSSAETIRTARKAVGLTQEKLGIALGVKPEHAQRIVAEWERGNRPIPRARLAEAAKVLKIPIEDLL